MSEQHSPQSPAVLYIDDEEQSLKYFSRLLGKQYRVLTAPSAAAGREVVEREDIGVIISDQRMPGETGVDLLTWARRERPLVTRMLTTAYSDLDSAIAAVNSGAVFQYLVKPWDLNDLRMAVKRAMDYHQVSRDRDRLLREKLVSLQRLVVLDRVRSFAVVATTLSHRLRNPLIALKTFLEAVPDDELAAPAGDEWGDLWDLARTESKRMLDLVEQVIAHVVRPEFGFGDRIDLAEHLAGELTVPCSGDGVSIACDAQRIGELVRVLVQRLAACRPDAAARIEIAGGATLHGQEAATIAVRCAGPAFDERERHRLFDAMFPEQPRDGSPAAADLLAAYFITFHHGGTLALDLERDEPGLVATLPADPTAVPEGQIDRDWLDRVFTLFEP